MDVLAAQVEFLPDRMAAKRGPRFTSSTPYFRPAAIMRP
jgi:hypothetical protein